MRYGERRSGEGGIPRYLTRLYVKRAADGDVKSVVNSMAREATAREARLFIAIVTSDTKSCVQRGAADKLFINTLPAWGRLRRYSLRGAQTLSVGDVLLVSGTLSDHGATILNLREQLGLDELRRRLRSINAANSDAASS